MDDDQIALLAQSLKEVYAAGTDGLDARLADLGWVEVVEADSEIATRLLFTAQGHACAASPVLDTVVLRLLAADLPGGADTVCYPLPQDGARPSATTTGVSGVLLRPPTSGMRIAVPLTDGEQVRLAVVDAGAQQLQPLGGIDFDLGWFRVTGPPPQELHSGASWAGAVALARRALAAELIGLAERALRLAVEHTSTRRQFGAPIAAFQAVRHRLADGEVALASARSLLAAAAAKQTALSSAVAKAQAGRAHDIVSASAVQVCGAIGATLEHPLHRYVNRGLALDCLLGGWADLATELGEHLRRTGDAPRLVEI